MPTQPVIKLKLQWQDIYQMLLKDKYGLWWAKAGTPAAEYIAHREFDAPTRNNPYTHARPLLNIQFAEWLKAYHPIEAVKYGLLSRSAVFYTVTDINAPQSQFTVIAEPGELKDTVKDALLEYTGSGQLMGYEEAGRVICATWRTKGRQQRFFIQAMASMPYFQSKNVTASKYEKPFAA